MITSFDPETPVASSYRARRSPPLPGCTHVKLRQLLALRAGPTCSPVGNSPSAAGRDFMAMNSGREHYFAFTPAMSLFVDCDRRDDHDPLTRSSPKVG
jgi:hypothetical protein